MKDEELIEKEIQGHEIFKGNVLDVRCDEIELPNGAKGTREYMVHKGAVCVIPLTEKGEVVCVRQYRYAVRQILLEIPAGKFNFVGEDPGEAARRELREETGAVCRELIPMGALISSPAILTEKIYMFLARGLSFGKTEFDEDEFIDVVKIPLSELSERVMRGEIEDAKTQLAVLKAAEFLRRERQ